MIDVLRKVLILVRLRILLSSCRLHTTSAWLGNYMTRVGSLMLRELILLRLRQVQIERVLLLRRLLLYSVIAGRSDHVMIRRLMTLVTLRMLV